MDARIAITAIGVAIAAVGTAVGFGAEALIGPEIQTTQGTVAHAGHIGRNGDTNFMLVDSGETYNCYTNEARECSMIKEGNKVSIKYYLYMSGARSVESLTFLDESTSTTTP